MKFVNKHSTDNAREMNDDLEEDLDDDDSRYNGKPSL